MSYQPRVAKVLAALLIAMTTGAIVLMALGSNPPSAGPFCLASYYRLDGVEDSVRAADSPRWDRWNAIEIYYSGTKAGNIEQLASLSGLASPDDINCHFVVCNGFGGANGQIQTTHKWLRQWSVIPTGTWYGTPQTIRICLVADALAAVPTDSQVKRTQALVDYLTRQFDIKPQSIHYPLDWR
jgi:hypothetical protein